MQVEEQLEGDINCKKPRNFIRNNPSNKMDD